MMFELNLRAKMSKDSIPCVHNSAVIHKHVVSELIRRNRTRQQTLYRKIALSEKIKKIKRFLKT